jgi:hypothetical protein
MASAESHAWCGRKVTVTKYCWRYVHASWPTDA